MIWILLAFALVFALCLTANIQVEKCYEQEISLLRSAITENKDRLQPIQAKDKAPQASWHKYVLPTVRIALGVLGITLFIIGIFNGGMADVLEKAINICTQCIGLG